MFPTKTSISFVLLELKSRKGKLLQKDSIALQKSIFYFTALTYVTPNNEKINKALYSNYLKYIFRISSLNKFVLKYLLKT